MRIRWLVAAFALTAAALAHGQSAYPSRPIHMVVPWPPGGPSDIVARTFSDYLGRELGQPVVIDNRGGANGSIGANTVAKAVPDGYTLMVQNMTSHATNPAVYRKLPFDTLNDFAWITQIASSAVILVVNPDLPVTTVADLIALARAKPGTINIASFGPGSLGHLAIEELKILAKIDVGHVPYKGGAPAVADTLAGHTQGAIVGLPVAVQLVKDGRLRALAVSTAQRSPLVPAVPAMRETPGLEGYDLGLMFAFAAPVNTPAPIVARLNAAALAVFRQADFRKRLLEQGLGDPIGNTPEETKTATAADIARLAQLIKAAGIESE
jgi:tripartite-type tricarboxylate transporter receptor subunit TctC